MKLKFKIGIFILFVFFCLVGILSHSPSILEQDNFVVEKTKIKMVNDTKNSPPVKQKKIKPQDQFKPVSQKFEIQQLSSQVYGTGGNGKGFLSGDQVLNSLNSVQEMTHGPSPKFPIQIQYPDFAKQKAIKGYVEIQALISQSGAVEQVDIIKSQPPGVFDDYVKNEIRKIKFSPAVIKGKVTAQFWSQKIRFEYE